MATQVLATIEDLARVDAKAGIVNGRTVLMPPAGGMGFRVSLPSRLSFSPDAAFFVGPDPGMRFYEGAPPFAVEVRSENDYGPQAEAGMAQKRANYFAAGTLVVWDVGLLSDEPIKSYRAADPATPLRFRRGEDADAEPAVPCWTFAVNDLFR